MGSAYVVAVFAILFSACSALTLINTLRHFDPPGAKRPNEEHVTV